MPADLEDRIVRLRKEVSKRGLDAGADSIRSHLLRDPGAGEDPVGLDDLADRVGPMSGGDV